MHRWTVWTARDLLPRARPRRPRATRERGPGRGHVHRAACVLLAGLAAHGLPATAAGDPPSPAPPPRAIESPAVNPPPPPTPVPASSAAARAAVAEAATRFLQALGAEGRAAAARPFDDANRLDWSYVPRRRQGLALGSMDAPARAAAEALLDASSSAPGAATARAIVRLEGILGRVEGNVAGRDLGRYFLTVFGDPARDGDAPWGWRIEGHHLSLNFTFPAGDDPAAVAVTPAFWGANPARVPDGFGDDSGHRALPDDEDLARELVRSLDPVRRRAAVVAEQAYPEILTGTAPAVRNIDRDRPQGIAWEELTEPQRAVLWRLIELHAGRQHPDFVAPTLARIGPPGGAGLHFAWAGGTEPGEGHYYRIQGRTFVLEYDNTQNGANHIHAVWRDFDHDFARDVLGDHLAHDHGSPGHPH